MIDTHEKYLFVTGGVVSSLGKGIVASSLGLLLKERGFSVTIQMADRFQERQALDIPHGPAYLYDRDVAAGPPPNPPPPPPRSLPRPPGGPGSPPVPGRGRAGVTIGERQSRSSRTSRTRSSGG